MSWTRTIVGAVALLLASCGPVLPPADATLVVIAQRRWPEADAIQLEQGHLLFITRCTTCHELRDPARYSPADWSYYVREMAPRAQLADSERQAVERYLVAARDLAEAAR